MSEFYIGLMSGTSADGIDAVLMDFHSDIPRLLASHYLPYSETIREKILALCTPGENEIMRLGELDILLARLFAYAVKATLNKANIESNQVKAIGSHGQTIRHYPNESCPFTLQIGDPNVIAAETGITTIADFRRKDVAYGGQGAPLVPAFHRYMMPKDPIDRAIINIGGIANVTFLSKNVEKMALGFDIGPGNVLLDSWINLHHRVSHDEKGLWAKSGHIQENLLNHLLSDPFFAKTAPKSTGREYFNLDWLNHYLKNYPELSPVDIQTTLTELTAHTIIQSVKNYFSAGEILICGGGAHNDYLMSRLKALGVAFQIATTEKYHLHPDWIEASAFAWLAYQTLNRKPGNLPQVTGAKNAAILGGIYLHE